MACISRLVICISLLLDFMSSFSEHSVQSLNKFLTGQQFPVFLLRAWNCKEMPLSDLGLSCRHQTTIIPK